MANYAFTDIEFVATESEKKEINSFLNNNVIPWNYGVTGESLSITSKWYSNIDEYLPRLSKLFPTVIFKYEVSYEEDETNSIQSFMINGKKVDYNDLKASRYLAYKQYMEDFYKLTNTKAKGITHEVEIMPDGLVAAYGNNYVGECNIYDWQDIVKISCGNFHTVGLTKDKAVLAVGANSNFECNLSNVKDKIIDISCGRYHTAILLESGKVIVKGNIEKEPEIFESFDESYNKKSTLLEVNQSDNEIIKTLEELGNYENTPVDLWPPVEKIISIFDAVVGVTSSGKIYINGFCPCTMEEIKKIVGIL